MSALDTTEPSSNLVTKVRDRAKTTFRDFTRGQKVVTLIAVIAVIATAVWAYSTITKPEMSLLYSNLSAGEASTMTEELKKQNVKYELVEGGNGTTTIRVPQEDQARLRMEMAANGSLKTDKSGYSLLDNTSITTSEFLQQVNYRRAVEGELSKTISSLDGVAGATVHLSIPEKDLFNDDNVKPTAAVVLNMSDGEALSSQQVQSVVNLVAGAVDGLDPKDVTVTDQTGAVLADPVNGVGGGSAADDATAKLEERLAKKIEDQLAASVGRDNVKATVTVTVNKNASNITRESFGKPDGPANQQGIALQTNQSAQTYQGDGGTPVGVLGTDGAPIAGVQNPSTTYTGDDQNTTYAVDRTVEETQQAGGAIERITVGVLVNASATQATPAQLTPLVQAAVGFDQQRGDLVVVNAAPFDTTAADAAKKAAEDAQAAANQDRLMSLIRSIVLGILILAVLVFAFLSGRKARKAVEPEPIDIPELDVIEDWDEEPEIVHEIEPGPSVVDEVDQLMEHQLDDTVGVVRGWMAAR